MKAEGGLARPLTRDASDNVNASWSRDGKWIYFTSNRSGQWQIWKMPSDGGEPVQLTKQGGFLALIALAALRTTWAGVLVWIFNIVADCRFAECSLPGQPHFHCQHAGIARRGLFHSRPRGSSPPGNPCSCIQGADEARGRCIFAHHGACRIKGDSQKLMASAHRRATLTRRVKRASFSMKGTGSSSRASVDRVQ
jgi:hypothetical protein